MLPQGLHSPHRTSRLELIVLNWTKNRKFIPDFGIPALFAIVFLYITYLKDNSFAVAPDQTMEQTICVN